MFDSLEPNESRKEGRVSVSGWMAAKPVTLYNRPSRGATGRPGARNGRLAPSRTRRAPTRLRERRQCSWTSPRVQYPGEVTGCVLHESDRCVELFGGHGSMMPGGCDTASA